MNPNPNLFCTNCGPSFSQGSIQPFKNTASHRPPAMNQSSFMGYGPHFNQQGPMNPLQLGPQYPNNQIQGQRPAAYNQQNRATRRVAGNQQAQHPQGQHLQAQHPQGNLQGPAAQIGNESIYPHPQNLGFPQNGGFGSGPTSLPRGNRQVENPVSAGFQDPHFYGPNPNNYSNLNGPNNVFGGQQFSGYGEQNGLTDKKLRQMSGAGVLDNMLQNTNHLVQRYRHQEINPQETSYGKVQMYEARPY